jgi:hypothetical protein
MRIVVRGHFNRVLAGALVHDLEAAVQRLIVQGGRDLTMGTALLR